MEQAFSVVDRNGVKLISVDCINRTGVYQAYYSTGFGGVSDMPYGCTMNLSLFKRCKNDTWENAHQNFWIFAQACGFELSRMSLNCEVHGNHVVHVSKATLPADVFDRDAYNDADGQVTTDRDIALFAYAADCVTIMMVDPIHGVSGTVHAGWRNSINGTIPNFVNAFCEAGGDVAHAIAAIGPAISKHHYKVDESRAAFFFALDLGAYLFKNAGQQSWQIDLPGIDRELLIREGLAGDNVHIAPWCTYENELCLPSYSRDGGLNATLGGILFSC